MDSNAAKQANEQAMYSGIGTAVSGGAQAEAAYYKGSSSTTTDTGTPVATGTDTSSGGFSEGMA
jgi:hypothetical protein